MTWLRNGLLVFDSLDRGGLFVFEFVGFNVLFGSGHVVSCRISWLKGERPGTRTLAAHRQKNDLLNRSATLHLHHPTSTPGIDPKIMEEPKTKCWDSLAGWCKYINAYQILINYEVYRTILSFNSYDFSVASITSGRVCSRSYSRPTM